MKTQDSDTSKVMLVFICDLNWQANQLLSIKLCLLEPGITLLCVYAMK